MGNNFIEELNKQRHTKNIDLDCLVTNCTLDVICGKFLMLKVMFKFTACQKLQWV